MNLFFKICIALSIGTIGGGIIGIITKSNRSSDYTERQRERGKKLWKAGSRFMTYITCLFLAVGFIWCVYYLVLGAVNPQEAEYASNMSGLIVSVLTIVSIAFAFYEFIRKK